MAAKITLCGLLLLFATNLYAAEPTLSEVYQTAQAGHLQEAEAMMTQVLNAHPDSAKAHFVKAEILAKEGRIAEARTEFYTAQRIQPSLLFAKPVAVDMLKRKLAITDQVSNETVAPKSGISSTSLIWGALIVIAFIVWMIIRSRSRPAYPNMSNAYGANPAMPNAGPGYYPPQAGAGGGLGSGIVGGLATGAAVGAGIVAGEVLMHRMLDDDHPNNGNYVPDSNQHQSDNFDMGGNDFGVTDNNSWDDSSSGSNDSSDWT
jgi:hypothetical protein